MKAKACLFAMAFMVCVSAVAPAQNLAEYLKVRNAFKIQQAAGEAALVSFIGKGVIEIRGNVQGTIGSANGGSLILEPPNGRPILVQCATLPEWILFPGGTLRIIVRAVRESEFDDVTATLVAAHPDGPITAMEEKAARVLEEKRKRELARAPRASRGAFAGRIAAPKVVGSIAESLPYYIGFIKLQNRRLPDEEAVRIAKGVLGFSAEHGIDARLVMAIVMVESGFNPNAISRSGAQGLGQLMPGTAAGMGVRNPYDSIDNLQATVRIIRGNLDKYTKQTGDDYKGLVLALAAYNAGGGNVRKYDGVPPFRETQNYIEKVVQTYLKMIGRA